MATKMRTDDEDDFQVANKAGRLPHHVKDPCCLCCALTRVKDILVVVGQMAALAHTAKVKTNVASGAISQIVKDAEDRGLVYHDVTTLDDSPAWLTKKQAWTAHATSPNTRP